MDNNNTQIILKLDYGALTPSLEEQLNDQGLTLGPEADLMEKLRYSLSMLWIHNVITDSQEQKAREKLHKIVKSKILLRKSL